MITHGKSIKIFTGNSNPELAKAICQELGVPLGNAEVGSFADGENYASIYETVRGSDVFVVQSTCPFEKDGVSHTVNDALMELLIMIDALKRASAGRITAVIPYFGYARQDRKTKPRDPISAKLVANLITRAGADRVTRSRASSTSRWTTCWALPCSSTSSSASMRPSRTRPWWSPPTWAPWPGPAPSLRSWLCRWPSWTSAVRRPTPPRL